MRGVATFGLVAALTLTGCAPERVDVRDPALDADDARACSAFVAALPDTLSGESRRSVEPEDAPAAAYGDPPITVQCGGRMPAGFDRFAACDEVNGVGWYLPPDQITDPTAEPAIDATLGTVGWRPVVELRVPAAYRPEGLAAALSDLAPVITDHLEQVRPCV